MRMVAVLMLAFVANSVFAQGKLDQVREAVDTPRSSDKCDKDDSSSSTDCTTSATPGCSSTDNSSGGDDLGAVMFAATIGAPWMAPYKLIDPGISVSGSFTRYPFAAPDTPHILLDRGDDAAGPRPPFHGRGDTQWYSVRGSVETGSDFNGLDRVGLRLFLDTDTRFGVKTGWDYFSERLDCGCRDSLWIGDVTGTFRFVQHEQIQMHTGLGARFLVDNGRDRAGFNFLYGFDAFPVEPVHLFGSFEAGTLGHAGVWRFTGGAGVNWKHAELFAGYDYLNIGGVSLQGPFVGLRLWF